AAFPGSAGAAALAAIGPTAVKGGNPTFNNLQNVLVTDVNPYDPNTNPTGTNCAATPTPASCVPMQFGSITRFLPSIFNDYEVTGRVDTQLTQKDRFFARYLFQQTINTNQQFFGAVAGAAGNFVDVGGRSQQIGLDFTHSFNERFLD